MSHRVDWKIMYDNIKKMRERIKAPVDTMGCHKCADLKAEPKIQRFHHLIALMLSSQTKDTVTYEAMNRLKNYGLEPNKIIKAQKQNLEKLIYPKKTENLLKISQILINKYDCDIPQNIDELEKLPGIGHKMANLCMSVAWNNTIGIGVDIHVHRISQRLEWIKPTKNPEETKIQLEKFIPKEFWFEINHLLVGFGQEICLPRNPKCDLCLNNNICPKNFTVLNKNNIKSKKRKIQTLCLYNMRKINTHLFLD